MKSINWEIKFYKNLKKRIIVLLFNISNSNYSNFFELENEFLINKNSLEFLKDFESKLIEISNEFVKVEDKLLNSKFYEILKFYRKMN